MRYVNNINYYLQWLWILVTAGIVIYSISTSQLGHLFLLLYQLFFVGINHLLFSLIHLIAYRRKSKMNLHLGLSILAIFTLTLGMWVPDLRNYPISEDLFFGTMIGCSAIGIYFISLVLVKFKPHRIRKHSYLDLY